ncbi:MAG: DUF748 domain-containing protein [Bacteroidetes bacterium]|nr:DUF748 domain-containing protein [Bacteroidota bacterium]
MKGKTIRKIVLWVLAVLILLAGAFFAVGYFYYAKILRNYITETVSRESNGLYKAEIGNLYLNLVAGNLTIDRFSLLPDTAFYRAHSTTDTLSPLLIRLTINQFRIRGFHVMDAVKNRKIEMQRIRFIGPEITVFRMRIPPKSSEDKKKEKMTSIPLPKGLTSIAVKEFLIENAKLDFVDCSKDSITRNSFPVCNISVRNILVDSAHQGQKRLFNADDISITLGAYSLPMKNGMNTLSFGEIGLSSGSEDVYIKDFHLEPMFNKHDYTRKLGYQTDWMDIRINHLRFHHMNFRKLLFEGKMQAELVEIDSLLLDDYRDKRIAPRPGFKPPMPQDAVRNLKTYLRIDTLVLKHGKASYAEQTGETPGTLFFDNMSASLTGLTNDSVLLNAGLVSELKGTASLMGKGKLDISVRFFFGDKRNTFTFSATMGPLDLTEINPMLSNLLPARVVSGKLVKLEVPLVYANEDVSTGKLLFYYDNLSVDVLDKKQTVWTKIKTGVINFAANDLIINNSNPSKAGKMKTGVIQFSRDKEKGIINFLWKSALSGLKSTMGFNSKAQKDMIRDEKQQVKEANRKEKKEANKKDTSKKEPNKQEKKEKKKKKQ